MLSLKDVLSFPEPWGKYNLTDDKQKIGTALLSSRVEAERVVLSCEYEQEHSQERNTQCSFKFGDKDSLLLIPELPDKAIFLQFLEPMLLEAGEELTINLSLPLFVRVTTAKLLQQTLWSFPAFLPHLAWYGKPYLGELMYWKKLSTIEYDSSAGHDVTIEDKENSQQALLSLTIRNASNTSLSTKNIVIRIELLGLYWRKEQLVADSSEVHLYNENGEVKFETSVVKPIKQESKRIRDAVVSGSPTLATRSLQKVLQTNPFRLGV